MTHTRSPFAIPVAVLASLVLLLVGIVPVLAAPSAGTSGSRAATAAHVDTGECNVDVDATGDLVLDGFTAAEVAAAQALLAGNADLAAALEAAADVDAEACINLEFTVDGETVTAVINADISICPATVEVNADGDLVVNGVVFAGDLANSDLAALVAGAAAADVAVCAVATVTDNAVTADVYLEACITATLNSNDTVTVDLGGVDLILDADAVIGADAALQVGVAAEVGIALLGTVDLATDVVELSAEIIAIEGCGTAGPTGGAAPTAVPGGDGDEGPAGQLPDTAVGQGEPTTGPALFLAALVLASVGVTGHAFATRRRR